MYIDFIYLIIFVDDGNIDKHLEKRVDKLGELGLDRTLKRKIHQWKQSVQLSADVQEFWEAQSQVTSDDGDSINYYIEEHMEEPANVEAVQRLIEEAIFYSEDDDSDLISNEKWHDLMDFPEMVADDWIFVL